ncbi:hypothetical protein [Paraburkholderia hospita]|jgi:hypothetical protein|uniref:hypothetical protein n=1 Tax=Paraburkholderia hospita TaxID=169430 RepID=UPI0012602F18|nr:hypothetical protein [Paraburkholderia hospita]
MNSLLEADDPAARLLFLTANSHYLASARLSCSGQCLPAYPSGRAIIESALYGWYIAGAAGAAQRWHDKPLDHAGLKTWNKEFKFSSLTARLAAVHDGSARWAKYLHQTAIDFAAHPNRETLYSNLSHRQTTDGGSSLSEIKKLLITAALAIAGFHFPC